MSGDMLIGLLWKMAPSLLLKASGEGLKKLVEEPPVAKAITATGNDFPGIEGLQYTLTTWCDSVEFRDLLERVRAGERNLTDANVVSAFITVSSFYAGQETVALAQQVIETFVQKVVEELYTASGGLSVHASREEVLHARSQDLIQETGQSINAQLSIIRQGQEKILRHLPPDDTGTLPALREKILHARVDEARSLLEEGKAKSAGSILERLRHESANQSPSGELQFRIATNLGVCALELGDVNAAKAEFRSALAYQPRNQKALANAALAALLDGNAEEALRLISQARELGEGDLHTTSIYLQVLQRLERTAEVDQLVLNEPRIGRDPTCSLILGSIRCNEGKYGDAEVFLRSSLRGDPQNASTHELLAQAIIAPIEREFRDDPPLWWGLDERTLDRIKEAESTLNKAIESFEHYENRARLGAALVNRAVVRGMVGHFEEALKDCDRALSENEMDEGALRNKGLMLLQMERVREAINCFEKIQGQDERSNVAFPLAAAYWAIGQPDKVIEILSAAWSPNVGDRRMLQVADLFLAAYAKTGNTGAVENLLGLLAETWPNDPEALSVLANQRRREGKVEEAIDLLQEGLAYAGGHARSRIALTLADLFYSIGRYAEAAEVYSTIVDKKADNPILRTYLVSLFNSGSYRETFLLAQTIRGCREAIPVVTEIEALVLEYIGDLERARELRLQLSRVEPNNIVHRIRVALLDLRRGDPEAARATLSNIPLNEIKENAQALIQVAQARALLGMPDVLSLAYRARRLDFGNPDMHLAYIGLFLKREEADRRLLEPAEVGIDCTIRLTHDGETKVFTILNEDSIDRERGELASVDPLATKLIGLRKGDRLVLKEGPLEQLSYEIADIQSKYVFAFQATLNGFTTWFPDHPALHRVELKGDPSKVRTLIDVRHERATQAMALYRERPLTLGALARLLGNPLIEVWAGMISQSGGLVIASSGTPEDATKELYLLSRSKSLVLDLTALLTLGYLDLLDRLPRRFEHIFVAQSVVDEINDTFTRRFSGPKPAMTVWKEGDHYVRQEISPESLEQGRNFLNRIQTFVESASEVLPVTGALDLGRAKFEEFKELLGDGAIASILVAKEKKAPLYSDDLVLRVIARNDWQIEGVWSQSVLLKLRECGVLTDEDYYDAIKRLALANYRFVSIDAEGLKRILEQNGMRTTDEVTRIFKLLHGPDCGEESAIGVMTDLIRRVWLQSLLYHQKLWTLDLALEAVTTGRVGTEVIAKLKAALRTRFWLMPAALQTVSQGIDLWQQKKLFRSGLLP